jgi:hypothetical protein
MTEFPIFSAHTQVTKAGAWTRAHSFPGSFGIHYLKRRKQPCLIIIIKYLKSRAPEDQKIDVGLTYPICTAENEREFKTRHVSRMS